MKIDGSGQRKTQRGVCSRAHGKRDPADTSYRVAKRSSDRSLTRRPCPQVLQGHLCVARPSSIDTLVTRPLPTGTPEPSPRGEAVFWPVFGTATLPTSTSVPSSRGKTVWNRCQTGLWPMPRPVFGTATQSTGASVASRRGEAVFNRRFGTATLPTGTSRASMRGETIFCRHSCHETPPTGTPVPSPRGEAVFYRSIRP